MFQNLPLGMPLVKVIRLCSDVDWSQPLGVLVLDILGGNLLQVNVRHCLWLAPDYLLEVTKQSTVDGCLFWAWGQSAKGLSHAEIQLCCQLPIRLGHKKGPDSTWVSWGSLSHQVGVSGGHQVDTDSNLASVMDLQPLSRSLRVQQDQPPFSKDLRNFVVKQSLRKSSG